MCSSDLSTHKSINVNSAALIKKKSYKSKRFPTHSTLRVNFSPFLKERSFIVIAVNPRNAYRLANEHGDELPEPWNDMYLKKYYA